MKSTVVFTLKAIRNFFNGVVSALAIYFYYRDVTFQEAFHIPLSIACILLAATIKQKIVLRYRRNFGHFNTLILAYLWQLFPFVIANDINMAHIGSTNTYAFYFSLGFFPFDGEDFAVFEQVEKGYLRHIRAPKQNATNEKIYERVGYISQAIGALSLGWYFFLAMEEHYDEKLKLHWALVGLSVLTLFSVLLNALLRTGEGVEIFRRLAAEEDRNELPLLVSKWRLRVHSLAEGFGYGLLVAPFISYYCELKLEYYYEAIGGLLCAYFLLKGLGRDILTRLLPNYPLTVRGLSLFSNLAIAAVAFFVTPSATAALLVCAFPMWHVGRVQLDQIIGATDESLACDDVKDDLRFWQKVGVACGVTATAFSFSTMYYRAIFAYPFVICAIVRQINQHSLSLLSRKINHSVLKEQEQMSELQARSSSKRKASDQIVINAPILNEIRSRRKASDDISIDASVLNITSKEMPSLAQQEQVYDPESGCRRRVGWVLYTCIAIMLFCFYMNSFHNGKFTEAFKLVYPRSSFARPPELQLFNASLGEYLRKQDVRQLALFGCDTACFNRHRDAATFAGLELAAPEPQWFHFPTAPYFTSETELAAFFDPLRTAAPSVRGFSVFWKHPIRYHKILEELRSSIHAHAGLAGFFYQEMPSLNLRGVEGQIVLVFGREARTPTQLPEFVGRPPPRNMVAFQTTFKMVMNLPELREFLLYHLRMGVDKFFLYDNDPPNTDPSLFEGNRITGYFKRCLRFELAKKYTIFQEIWSDFYDHIVYIPWTTSRINFYVEEYPQNQAYEHYFLYFKEAVRYTSFTDLDEFIYTTSRRALPEALAQMEEENNVGAIYIVSKFFQFHICNPGKLNIEMYNWGAIPFRPQALKVIMMNKLMVRPYVHGRQAKNGRVAFPFSPLHDYQMWHYQFTTNFLKRIQAPVPEFNTDESMKPLVKGLKEACRGKCTDSFRTNCTEKQEEELLKEFCLPWPG